MTRYRVPVADPLLAERDTWTPVTGFRLVSVDGPWLVHPDVTICTFEDDGAPPALEGKLVDLIFQRHEDGPVTIMSRQVIGPAVTAPISPPCNTGRHHDCAACDCTCHRGTTQYQPPQPEGETP